MARRSLPLSKVYGLLEPGPVILLTTVRDGVPDVMTLSWHTMLEFEPPLVGVVLSDRDYSYDSLVAGAECVIAIPTVDIAHAVVGCGNTSGRDTDKFAAFGLTALPASEVAAPLIAECQANLECRVHDTTLVARYGFFVLEVVKAWIDPARRGQQTLHHRGYGRFMVSGTTIRLPSRMR